MSLCCKNGKTSVTINKQGQKLCKRLYCFHSRYPISDVSKVTCTSRKLSFTNVLSPWPHAEHLIQPLSAAGFYFTCLKDIVHCYLCGLELQNLQDLKCPFKIHVSYSPSCTHIVLNKGLKYVEAIKNKIPLVQEVSQTVKPYNPETDSQVCCICKVKKVNLLLFPCMHVNTCPECTSNISHCPICRSLIHAFTFVYLS
jgi:hypothetical protein